MRLKYLPLVVLTLVLMLSSTVNASVYMMNLNVAVAASGDDKESKSDKPVILAQDNSKILATSGMSTMFTIWNMTPFEYCSKAVAFNLRYTRIPCNAKAF